MSTVPDRRETLPVIIYIVCPGHSGSTLLDLLISSHDRVCSVGEVRQFEKYPERRCSCGAADYRTCVFWSQVDNLLSKETTLHLPELDMCERGSGDFAAEQTALFSAVARVSQADHVVDSSKHPVRLARLLEVPGLDVRPICLQRKPQGVVWSNMRKNRPWFPWATHHGDHVRLRRRVLRNRPHLVVEYEDLARKPGETLETIMEWLGLDYQPSQLDWAGRERHNYRGNRMRKSGSSAIEYDEEWTRELGWITQQAIGMVSTLFSWFPFSGVFRYLRTRFRGSTTKASQ